MTNSVDPDQTAHQAQSGLVLHYLLRPNSWNQYGNKRLIAQNDTLYVSKSSNLCRIKGAIKLEPLTQDFLFSLKP